MLAKATKALALAVCSSMRDVTIFVIVITTARGGVCFLLCELLSTTEAFAVSS